MKTPFRLIKEDAWVLKTKGVILRREFAFFNKGDVAFLFMKGRRSIDAALDSVRMQWRRSLRLLKN